MGVSRSHAHKGKEKRGYNSEGEQTNILKKRKAWGAQSYKYGKPMRQYQQ